ncbi:MAG TPA: hypothetical protein VHN80_16525 [Kineosporiaceae bacterium]|nr:hypothetical protein [Kineosporiaceae bacterium]
MANVAGRTQIRRAYLVHIHVAIRFDHQRHIEFRKVGDPADHARVAVDAYPPPELELVE